MYRGSEGVDFNANLAVSTIDFGTFHVRLPVSGLFVLCSHRMILPVVP